MSKTLYWESQKGDLCRLHSLNTYFGYKKISENEFKRYCQEYNKYIKDSYNEIIKSENYDIFPTYSLMSYIIHQIEGKYCYFIPYGGLKKEIMPLEKLLNKSSSFFVFNRKHVFTVKYHNKKWYKIDSLAGILPITLSRLQNDRLGFIIPRNDEDLEFDKSIFMTKIKNYLNQNNIETKTNVVEWMNNNYEEKLLDDMEIYLAHLNQILINQNQGMTSLVKLMSRFNQNKMDIPFITRHLARGLFMLGLVIKIKN